MIRVCAVEHARWGAPEKGWVKLTKDGECKGNPRTDGGGKGLFGALARRLYG